MSNAVECIKRLERTLDLKAETYKKLLRQNRLLLSRLTSVLPSACIAGPGQSGLYRCEVCQRVAGMTDIRTAFRHQEEFHPPHHPHTGPRRVLPVPNLTPRLRGPTPVKARSEVMTCRLCPTTSFDPIALNIHSLLHKDLVLFLCPYPRCSQVYGLPSKLKRHYFLDHEMVLATTDHCRVNLNNRINITRYGLNTGEMVPGRNNVYRPGGC